jgi:hypothetical protein
LWIVFQVGNFFYKTRFVEENTAAILAKQASPYPRMHYFTFDSCMGEVISDGSILTPALTVGPKVVGLDVAKFNSKVGDPCRPFLLSGADGQPLMERLVLGAEGNPGATVVHSAIVAEISKYVLNCNEGKYWPEDVEKAPDGGLMPCTDIGFLFKSLGFLDSMEIVEGSGNLADLMSEYLCRFDDVARKKIEAAYSTPEDWKKRCDEVHPPFPDDE